MKSKSLKFASVLMSVINLIALSVRGEPAAPADSKPAAIAHVTVGSLDQLSALSDDLGIPLPSFLTAAGSEDIFAFIGQGGMRKELPLSLDYLAGGNLQQAQQAMFFLPLVAGHAPIGTFVQQGQAMGVDGAVINGVPFRRTGNYIIWGGTPELVTTLAPDNLPDAKRDNPLLEITYDAKLHREVAPKQVEDFRDSQLQQDAQTAKTKSELAGQRIAVDAMTRVLDRLLFRLEKKEDLLRMTAQIEPSPTFSVHQYQKPGLPEACAFRIDWQPPKDWLPQGTDRIIDLVGKEEFFKDSPGGANQQDAFKELIVRAAGTVFDGDVATYGMELLDDGPVFYSVTQSNSPRDIQADFTDLRHRADQVDGAHKKTTRFSSYKLEDGTEVSRLIGLNDDGTPEFYVDAIDQPGFRRVTIAKTDTHAIGRLMGLKAVGPLNDPAAGWIDGKQTLALVAALGKTDTLLTGDDRETLNKVLGGQRINWTVNNADNRLNVILDVPVLLVKNIAQNTDSLGKIFAKMNSPTSKP